MSPNQLDNRESQIGPTRSRATGAVNGDAKSVDVNTGDGGTRTNVVDWLIKLRAELEGSAWQKILDLDGISALDVLVSPIYLAALDVVRRGAAGAPACSTRRGIRDFAYLMKHAAGAVVARMRSAKPSQVDVLFWPRDVTHIQGHAPVAKALRKNGEQVAFFACQPKVQQMLDQARWPAVSPYAAWPDRLRMARRDALERVKALLAVDAISVPQIANVNLDQEVLVETLRNRLAQFLPLACQAVTNAQLALEQFGPKALVVGNDITFEGRAGALVARKKDIPSVVLMHGSFAVHDIQRLHIADKILVYGEAYRNALLHDGIEESRIEVTGAPYLDGIPTPSGRMHPLIARRLRISSETPVILVATSGPGHVVSEKHHAFVIQQIARLSARMPDVAFLVKLHRKDRIDYYHPIIRQIPYAKLHIAPHGARGYPSSIFDWLQGCRMVLTGSSTVALEAMIQKVPVVTMDFVGEISGVEFIDASATVHVTSPDELELAVRNLLYTPEVYQENMQNAARYIASAFFRVDGHSSERAAQAISAIGTQHQGNPRLDNH